MRIAILGFLAGIFWLQQQAELPPLWWWTLPAMLLPVAWLLRQHPAAIVRGLRYVMLAAACAALGVAWAAWRAELRLAELLNCTPDQILQLAATDPEFIPPPEASKLPSQEVIETIPAVVA